MEKPTFAAALTGSNNIAACDLVFPESYHSCFTNQDKSLPFIKNATRRNGKPAFILTADEQLILADPLKHTLICKFSARIPSFDLIKKHFESLRLKGPWRIGILDIRHVMIKLELEQDYAFLFTKKLHRIENVLVKFLKWTADFDFKSEPPIAPIWIKFPSLKLHLFHKQFLFSLATVFGKPLKLDLPTFNLSRPSAARVLVEMDITHSYADEIWIGSQEEGYWQDVVFDSKPLYCSNCRIFGHCLENCFITNPQLRKDLNLQPSFHVPDPKTYSENQQSNVLDLTGRNSSQDALLPSSNIHNGKELNLHYSHTGALPNSSKAPKNQHIPATGAVKPVTAYTTANVSNPQYAEPEIFKVTEDPTGSAAPVSGLVSALPVVDRAANVRNTSSIVGLSPPVAVGDLQAPNIGSTANITAVLGNHCNTENVICAEIDHQPVLETEACSIDPVTVFTAVKGKEIITKDSIADVHISGSVESSTVLKCPPVPKFSDALLGNLGTAKDAASSKLIIQPGIRLDANSTNQGATLSAVSDKEFSTSYPATAKGVSTFSAASPSTLTMHAPVYNMQPNFHSDLNSEQGNTDSDSYETYTGSYIEEDLQLNEACKGVLEEWQADWEYQKSKKKQKGIRELKGLRLNMGNSRNVLGSRRSLSGHL